MGQLIVRNLDDDIIARLKARASKDEQSLEQTVRDILAAATRPSQSERLAIIDRIRAKSKPSPDDDSTWFIRQWRDRDPSDR
jgi:plasmid stability protein